MTRTGKANIAAAEHASLGGTYAIDQHTLPRFPPSYFSPS